MHLVFSADILLFQVDLLMLEKIDVVMCIYTLLLSEYELILSFLFSVAY